MRSFRAWRDGRICLHCKRLIFGQFPWASGARQTDYGTIGKCFAGHCIDLLAGTGGDFAQLKRLVAVTGDKMVMAPTLDEAMTNLFLKQAPLLVFNHSPG